MSTTASTTACNGATDWRTLRDLAPLLIYPSDDLGPCAAYCDARFAVDEPQLFELIEASLRYLESQPRHALEELYTCSFDLNPISTLEVGWHLYGEQYERGRFLARAREMLSRVGQDEGGELPDYLPTLLCALPRLAADEAIDLAAFILPAVHVMCDALADKGTANPYLAILDAVRQALTVRVPEEAVVRTAAAARATQEPPAPDLVQIGTPRKRQP